MRSKIIFFVILAITAFPYVCSAAGLTIGDLLGAFVSNVVWPVAVGAAIIFWIWTGILFLMSEGAPDKLSTAKKALMWAIIGTIVIVVAYSAVTIIQNALNLSGGSNVDPAGEMSI